MAEIFKIELEKNEFLEQIKNNWNSFKAVKNHTTKAIATYAVDNSLVTQEINTINKLAKDKLRDLILEAQEPSAEMPKARQISTGSENLANDLINILDELKKEIQNRPLNKFIKNRAILSTNKLLIKIEDDKTLENIGTVGNIFVLVCTVIDVFVDLKTIPEKIKKFREKRANANNK